MHLQADFLIKRGVIALSHNLRLIRVHCALQRITFGLQTFAFLNGPVHH